MVDFGQLPIQLELGPDWRILLFLAAIGILTGLVFGLVPAFRTTRSDLAQAVKGAGRSDAAFASRQRLSRVVVAFQVAVSLLLTVMAGLLIQTIYNLYRLDKGFRTENVVLFDLASNSTRRLAPEVLVQIAREVPSRIQQLPGIQSAGVTAPLSPFQRQSSMYSPLLIPGAERTMVLYSSVSPGYLETMGIALVAGRSIEERDTENAPLVAVINEAMARRFFPDGAVGRIVNNSPGPAPPAQPTGAPGPPIEIVGVMPDSKYNDLREKETQPLFYVPVRQRAMPLRSLVVRTREPLASIEPAVRQVLLDVNRDLMIRRTVTLSDQVAQSFSAELMIMRLCVFFGGLALLLACIGLYGTMSYAVTQRKGEIGIRMALGATQRSILRLVLGESFVVVLAGVVVAVPATFITTRLVANFLYGVTPADPVTMALATSLLLAAAAFAAYLPAHRASRVDPMTALRQD